MISLFSVDKNNQEIEKKVGKERFSFSKVTTDNEDNKKEGKRPSKIISRGLFTIGKFQLAQRLRIYADQTVTIK